MTNLDLTKKEIISLIKEGWRCDDYDKLCPVASHKGKTFHLLEIPSEEKYEELAKDETFSGREGNAIILHIGQITARLCPEQNTKHLLIIPPGRFVFFMTEEAVNMPLDCDGTLFMNPATSNKGLLFFTLGHVDPGFRGHLTATLLNTTSRPIPLKRHEGVLYLVLSRLVSPSKPHDQFHEHPRIEMDQAMRDLSYNLNPGFALTTQDFATKDDLRELKWFVGVGFTVLGLVVALLKLL